MNLEGRRRQDIPFLVHGRTMRAWKVSKISDRLSAVSVRLLDAIRLSSSEFETETKKLKSTAVEIGYFRLFLGLKQFIFCVSPLGSLDDW